MKNLTELMQKAQEYTEAYRFQFNITDTALLYSIYISHLAYLINAQFYFADKIQDAQHVNPQDVCGTGGHVG